MHDAAEDGSAEIAAREALRDDHLLRVLIDLALVDEVARQAVCGRIRQGRTDRRDGARCSAGRWAGPESARAFHLHRAAAMSRRWSRRARREAAGRDREAGGRSGSACRRWDSGPRQEERRQRVYGRRRKEIGTDSSATSERIMRPARVSSASESAISVTTKPLSRRCCARPAEERALLCMRGDPDAAASCAMRAPCRR